MKKTYFLVKELNYKKEMSKSLISLGFVYLVGIILEFLLFHTFIIVIAGIFFIITFVIKSMENIEKKQNKEIFEKIRKLVKARTLRYIQTTFDNEVKETKSIYSYDIINHYGRIGEQYYLILLSNGQVLEYTIQSNISKNGYVRYSIEREPHLCNNPNHLKKIKKQEKNMIKEFITGHIKLLLLLTILVAGGFFFTCGLILFVKHQFIFVGVILFCVLSAIFSKYLIAFRPFKMMLYALNIIFHIISIFIVFVFSYTFCFGIICLLPFMLFKILVQVGFVTLNTEVELFISLSFGSIFAVHLSKLMKKIIIDNGIFRDYHDHAFRMYINKLVVRLLDKTIIHMLIYLLYFCFLAVKSFVFLQTKTYLISEQVDYAVLHAFLVYIAFSGFITAKTNMKWNIDEIFEITIKAMTAHDDDPEFIKRNISEPLE